jgi:beta-glucosidase
VASWKPGIANILFGRVNPSGKLPLTFAAREADLPHPHVTGLTEATTNNGMNGQAAQARNFTVDYNVEGMLVGYKWFQAKHEQPLFPFGFGLSYTAFAYSNLKLAPGAPSVSFDLRNTGNRAGDEIAQAYVTLPTASGEPFRKLAGWKRVTLAPGASQTIEIPLDPLLLSVFSVPQDAFQRLPGDYLIEIGGSSASLPLHQTVALPAR